MEIEKDDAASFLCWRDFQPCRGSKCMAWNWTERTKDRTQTNNLKPVKNPEPQGPTLLPEGDPPVPSGECWVLVDVNPGTYHRSKQLNLPMAKFATWERDIPRTRGQCGLAPRDYF